MKKLFKWLLRILISLTVLIVAAAVVLPLVFDPNDYKHTIESKIEENIGRQAQLNGDIEWSVFPWLALSFNDVSIDNELGFNGEKIARIQKLSARVKLLPLLKKNIEVGKIIINEAELNLEVASSGKSNWQSMLDNFDEKSDETESRDSSTLNIEGIILNDVSINYKDILANTYANITDFSMETSEIAENISVKTEVNMRVQLPDSGLDVDVETGFDIHHLLSDSNAMINMKFLVATGKLTSESELPLMIKLVEPGVIDFENDSTSMPQLEIKAGDAIITTNVLGKDISKQGQFSGQFNLPEFDLNDLFKRLFGSEIVSSDVFDAFSSKGDWQLYKDSLKINNLTSKFNQSTVSGNVNIVDLEKMKGFFDFEIDTLNVDKFLAGQSSSKTPHEKAEGSLDFGQFSGSIDIDKMLASGTIMENITMQVKTNRETLVLAPVMADFYHGSLNTIVKVDAKAEKNKVIVGHSMTKIQAGPLLTDLVGSELLTGIGNLNVDINIDEPFSDSPLKSSHGHIDYQLGKGAIYGIDVFGMMQQGLILLYPEVVAEPVEGEKKTSFALMQIDADINDGILKTNILKVESPYLIIDGAINIDLANMTINGTIEPMLIDIPEQLISDKYKKLLKVAIPVSLSGSLLEPHVKIDAKQLLLNTQKEKIEKEKEKLKGKLLDSLFGKKKEKESS